MEWPRFAEIRLADRKSGVQPKNLVYPEYRDPTKVTSNIYDRFLGLRVKASFYTKNACGSVRMYSSEVTAKTASQMLSSGTTWGSPAAYAITTKPFIRLLTLAVAIQLPCFLRSHMIHFLIVLRQHVKAIENTDRTVSFLCDHRPIKTLPPCSPSSSAPLLHESHRVRYPPAKRLLDSILCRKPKGHSTRIRSAPMKPRSVPGFKGRVYGHEVAV